MNICWKCPHLQVIQDVDEFVSSSDFEKFSIASLAQQWMLFSEWVPSEWESDKNITIIHSPSVNVLRRQKLRVCEKQNDHLGFLFFTLNWCFCLKY